jgi:hypothetical protein
MQRLGYGYGTLANINVRLGCLALKGYLAGPYEDPPARRRAARCAPVPPSSASWGAVFGVVAAQAALRERETSGRGQRVSSACLRARFLTSTHMAGMIATGPTVEPKDHRRPVSAHLGCAQPRALRAPCARGVGANKSARSEATERPGAASALHLAATIASVRAISLPWIINASSTPSPGFDNMKSGEQASPIWVVMRAE